MSGSKSRDKGRRGEIRARDFLRRWFPECQRSFGQARKEFSQPDLLGVRPFYFEVKSYRKVTAGLLKDWWGKMLKDWTRYEKETGHDCAPILMWKENGTPWTFGMHAETAQDIGFKTRQTKEPVSATQEQFKKALDMIYPIHVAEGIGETPGD